MVKFPEIEVQLSGEDGNAYAIMGEVKRAMERAGCSKEDVAKYLSESQSGDYDHLLQTAMETVTVS
jgi:hypothetical protein